MSQAILNTGKSIRQIALHKLGQLDETLFDIQPEGCNNTIRWHIGHVVVSLDAFFSLTAIPFNSNLPESYSGLFKPGTKPADWNITPPSKEELLQYLSQQLQAFSEISPELLDENLKTPFVMGPLNLTTAAEAVNFAFVHEAMHMGNISTMVQVITGAKNRG